MLNCYFDKNIINFLQMDNNRICGIEGAPFNDMPRLRVLSMRSNRMNSVSENAFKRLRSNIAVLDIDGNPLSCSCDMIWLRGWLQQGSTEGPKCADGTLFKEMRLSRQDCLKKKYVTSVHPGCEAEMINQAHELSSCNNYFYILILFKYISLFYHFVYVFKCFFSR